ncbi:helix-turn-helix domain-containing protein [Streptomyces sp. MP131-18]|uniref:helix-turn-helix domain-containing protein n=1 Tax=Streptomyces sp. MP131-18 TaxID=1857892 RepID=UPI00097C1776|nr:helix-turn-helix domain-containing protein [Streptomyces sp. MP131-18]ONK14128.1 helix-turn-helix protein [Streptomyces sp. MP131-18]
MDARSELSGFLRSRRDRIRPEEHGLPAGERRRSPGLRRAEVAQLAGISVDYYIRLEQGKAGRPSSAVLDALARALRLAADERDHLYLLARAGSAPPRAAPVERVRDGVHRLLSVLAPTPAYVLGRRMDVLAWNATAAALFGDFPAAAGRRNLVWHVFRDPAARSLYADWEQVARQGISHLRLSAGRHPGDPGIAALVTELSSADGEFRNLWARHDVRARGNGSKAFNHPVVGRLTLDYEALQLPDGPDQHLITYTAPPGSSSQAALDRLAETAVSSSAARRGG